MFKLSLFATVAGTATAIRADCNSAPDERLTDIEKSIFEGELAVFG